MTSRFGEFRNVPARTAVGPFPFLICITLFGCGPGQPIEIAATSIAVEDMVKLVPEEAGPDAGVFVTGFWHGKRSMGEVPEEVIRRTGLPVFPDSLVVGNDSSVAILHLFPPLVFPGDSVEVYSEWIVIPPHSGSFWGHAYNYYFRCKWRCRLLRRMGPGHLN